LKIIPIKRFFLPTTYSRLPFRMYKPAVPANQPIIKPEKEKSYPQDNAGGLLPVRHALNV
jgi:hypothetical protein